MTIPTDTDSDHRPSLALVPDQDDADLYLTAEEEDRLYGGPPLVGAVINIGEGFPFFKGSRFEDVRGFLPNVGYFVYHLRDWWGQPLYIGQSRNVRSRLHTHWMSKPWIQDVAGIELFQTANELAARNVERIHTDRHDPPYSQVTLGERLMLDRLLAADEDAVDEGDQ